MNILRATLKATAVAALFAALLMPLLIFPGATYPFIAGKVFWFRLMTDVAAVFWLLAFLMGDRSSSPRRLVVALVILLVVQFLADILSPQPAFALLGTLERQEGLIALAYFAAHLVMVTALLRGPWLRRYAAAMVLVSIVVAASGIYTAIHWWPHKYGGGTLGNPGYLGIYCGINVMLALWLARGNGLWWAAAAVDTAALLATQSRGAVLALAVGLVVAGRQRITMGYGIALTVVALACVGAIYVLGIGSERLPAWALALEMFERRPVLGWGQEQFHALWQAFGADVAAPARTHWDRAHNWILDRLVDGGIVGLAAWCWLIACLARMHRSDWMYGCLAVYLTGGMFLFDTQPTLVALCGVAAMALSVGPVVVAGRANTPVVVGLSQGREGLAHEHGDDDKHPQDRYQPDGGETVNHPSHGAPLNARPA